MSGGRTGTSPPGRTAGRSASRILQWSAAALAVVATTLLAAQVLHIGSAPIFTNDAWWHLAMGEVYAEQGPWISEDPFLHTAREDGPVPHEWLFEVVLHLIDRHAGLHGLRLFHVLAALATLGLAASLFRRESPSLAATAAATGVFIALAWWRLIQLRPDLLSLPATLLAYRLVLEPRAGPSWRRIAAFGALMLVWANLHSLFALGLLLPLAGLVGIAVEHLLRRHWVEPGPGARRADPRLRRTGLALACGFAVALLNPRGIGQHLTFLTSSREAALSQVIDEWMPFHPFSWHAHGPALRAGAVNLPAWVTADAVMAIFLVVVLVVGIRLLRRPTARRLETADPVLAAVGAASVVAALAAIRFLWMLAFAMLLVLHVWHLYAGQRTWRTASTAALAAGVALALTLSVPRVAFFRAFRSDAPRSLQEFWSRPYEEHKFHADAVSFLEETGIEGNLFNFYGMGGFLEYRVGPRLKTFIDSRTEHYPPDVLVDYTRLVSMRGSQPGEGFLELLDRRDVDVFLGTGTVGAHLQHPCTTTHLEGAPGWTLVWRSWRNAVHVRSEDRASLERAASWYRRQGVPFDPGRGLDVAEVVHARPAWAESRGLAPPGFAAALARRDAADAEVRFAALDRLGAAYAMMGAYAEQAAVEEEALRLRPEAPEPRRRRIYALLRLGRHEEAVRAATELLLHDPEDDRARKAFRIATRFVRLRERGPYPALALLARFPLQAGPPDDVDS